MMRDYKYYKSKLEGIPFPYACLDIALLHNNIDKNIARAGDKLIRIASKSVRCPDVMRMILERHPQIQGLMVYHGLEAVYLCDQGFDDILMGYPIVDRSILKRIAIQLERGKYVCLMVDTIEHLEIIEAIGRELDVIFPICLDLDLSDNYPGLRFGVWRSTIVDQESLAKVAVDIKNKNNLRLDGLMGYEAQVAGLGDRLPGQLLKNKVISILKKRSIKRIVKKRAAAVKHLQQEGFNLKIVNGGGTGSLESTSIEDVITEVTVGSGFYNSHLFDNYSNFDLEPALFYGIQIVRKPTQDIYTCHGGGYIASGAIEKSKAPIIHLPPRGSFISAEGAGEVQTPVTFRDLATPLKLGDPIYLRHAKSGEVCERFNRLLMLEDDKVSESLTYRGLNLNFG